MPTMVSSPVRGVKTRIETKTSGEADNARLYRRYANHGNNASVFINELYDEAAGA